MSDSEDIPIAGETWRCAHPRCQVSIKILNADVRPSDTTGPFYCVCGSVMVKDEE